MALTLDVADDHWPSLAPIRTSATSSCLHAPCDTISNSSHLPEDRHEAACSAVGLASCTLTTAAPSTTCSPSAPDQPKASDENLARQASCCFTIKKPCINLLSCFSPTKQTSSPRLQRPCTSACIRKNGPVLRSIAFLFPAGGFQSFYSSPRGKAAQLSGAFPHTPSSGKLQQYASPRTPGNHPLSCKIQHFPSPRTPGSGNLQCLSAPRTPASGKVQHFSGAIPSPRTPFGSGAASPSSARRRKSSFTLFMPPTTADKKKTGDQLEEPTSPQVTCIGRVRRQTHCKKPHYKDIINPQASSHDTIAKKKGKYSKKPHSGPGPSTCHISSNEAMKSLGELSTTEGCEQKFGRNQLHNLHKIHGFGDESGDANGPDRIAPDCNEGDNIIPIANGHIKDLMHLESQNHGRYYFLSNVECINGNMRSLQQASHVLSESIRMHDAGADDKVEFMEDDKVELSADILSMLHTRRNGLHLEAAYDQSQCQKTGLQLNTSRITTQSTSDHCLLSMRNSTSRRRASEFEHLEHS